MEIAAVVFAIIYLLLAVKQDIKCWFAAIISSILYFFIMYDAGLYMEAYLQIFYIMMAFYGIQQWRSVDTDAPQFIVRTWDKRMHIKIITLIVIMTLISGFLLEKYTNAILPFIDGLTTWGAIVATYMVAKRLLENWIYWLVIDSISIFLFISRDLFPTAFLFGIYIIIIIYGYRSWSKKLQEDNALST